MNKPSRVFIIAEAGVNHNGDVKIAKALIREAKKAGADAIKFQIFKANNLASRISPKAKYQKNNTNQNESQFTMLKKLELSEKDFVSLLHCAKREKICFLSSPFDFESIELLKHLKLDIIKIPSGEITNYPYLKKIGELKKYIILSTGMATLKEIKYSLEILIQAGTPLKNITILHCNTEYPTPYQDVNLRAMKTIHKTFRVKVGYSDHTLGIEIPIAAVALGASVIEKHLTLNKKMQGPDHKSSLEPSEFKTMVTAIRNIEQAMGDGVKRPTRSEIHNRDIVRKSIVASIDIKRGERFSESNLTTKRPGWGISPMKWNKVIGKKSKRHFQKGELITQ